MSDTIDQGVTLLRNGGVVAFPTETVYGLGADATNLKAVRRVFTVKGRPATNPVIVHVADASAAKRYTAAWPLSATQLTEKFWPGPLTIILPKSDVIVTAATAGRKTVGLRSPDHPLTLELLRQFDGPVIGPSANRSSRVSPTTADDVREELGSKIDLVLDGGACKVGIESTVLDLSVTPPMILRHGAITKWQIEQVIGPVEVFGGTIPAGQSAPAPGMQGAHYAPATPTYRFERKHADRVAGWCNKNPAKAAIIIRLGSAPADDPIPLSLSMNQRQVIMPPKPVEYARHLYATLRHSDRQNPVAMWLEMPPDESQWLAVRDRLMRATRLPPQV
ncbi:MAG TPA: L-threonylcarbamoyladenylate synthase [Tepidisphaeraceae bacterium]|nr:L-threonylcarbamoyladenylate synthase [Tepidisphaeraceae bacterium]